MTISRHLFVLVGVLLCGHKLAFAMEVALIGDKSKLSSFTQIALDIKAVQTKTDGILRATSPDNKTTFSVADANSTPFQIANQVRTADIALLVVDSTQGPLPSVREQLIIARQARIPQIAIYFSNTRTLQNVAPKDAAELLELEEIEMRELMGKYEMKGDKAEVFLMATCRESVNNLIPLERKIYSTTWPAAQQSAQFNLSYDQ